VARKGFGRGVGEKGEIGDREELEAWERGRLVSRVGGGEKAKNGLVDEKTMEVEERASGSSRVGRAEKGGM
jgi:hypothetical protein